MPQKRRRPLASVMPAQQRPVQDVVAAKAATNFPTVGMTLHSYQYDPRDQKRRQPGRPPIVRQGRWQRWRHGWSLKRVVISLFIIVMLIGGFVGGKFLYNAHKLFGGNIFGILHSTKLKGENTGRVNILLAGNSADDPGHGGADLTDSIMVISIDTVSKRAFLLSLPRDLWVHVPGDGHEKLNHAYVVGEDTNFSENGYPNGGMGELAKVASNVTGLDINYYALVDYQALKQSVDAVGGVDFTVKSTDPRGLYDPNIDWTNHGPLVRLSNGTHHLNGQQALDLARARGDAYNSYGFAGSDFDRTEHQRQLLVALKARAVSAGTISNPAKLSSLFDAIGSNVKTDFTLGEVHRLYDLIKDIGGGNIKSLSLNQADGTSLLASYAAPDGQSALIPAAGIDDFSDIRAYVDKQTSSNPVVQEGAKVIVLNGTTSDGLATKVKNKLKSQHFLVGDIGDAGNTGQLNTAIINNAGNTKPATAAALTKIFGNHLTTQNPYQGTYDADFIIVLGKDQISATTQ